MSAVTAKEPVSVQEVRSAKRPEIRGYRVFALFFVIYLFTMGGHYTSGDGFHKVQWARQIISGGPYWIDASTGAPPKYGIGHTLIAMPAMLASKFLQSFGLRTEAALYTLLFALNGAFLLYLLAKYLAPRYPRARVWSTLIAVGLATSWWPYTKLDYSEPLIATAFFASFLLLKQKRILLGFLLAGFLLLLRTDSVILIALLVAWQSWQDRTRKTLALASAGLAPSVLTYVALNLLRFGTVLDLGYSKESFSTPLLVGLYGILFSAGKSVFLFSPPLIAGFVGWRAFRDRFRSDAVLFASVFVVQLVFYSKWWDWSGDDSWGVRFLLLSVVLMTIPIAEVNSRVFVGATLALGILVQIPAVAISGLDYVLAVHKPEMKRVRWAMEGSNVIDVEEIRFNPRYSQLAAHTVMMRDRLGFRPRMKSEAEQRLAGGTDLSDVLPPQASSGERKWDFWWYR